ncbi:MAG: SWIM zinc finger family protein, partial [Phycisphaerae bacterium]
MPQTNEKKRVLTLKDRLSRLTHTQACRLLGGDGERLIRQGGGCEINIDEQVYLGGDLFRLSLGGAVVTITVMAEARNRLRFNCTRCSSACEHIGAAFSLILEEKTALGLAARPADRTPVESLSEEELVQRALTERRERARAERMTIRSTDPARLWTDYLVTNAASGKTYRVALRGWEAGESYCSCPDFRKNTLGVCKHIFKVQQKARRRFPETVRRRGHRRKNVAVHLQYGREIELRLLAPAKPDRRVESIIRPIERRPVRDLPDLMNRVRKLTALGEEITIYPDAEEYITRQLHRSRIQSRMARIRKDPRNHPLRKSLLKAELLPYQLDGVAF